MATLEWPTVTFIESEAAQQNWLHDPETIVIGNFTEGTHYVTLTDVKAKQIQSSTGVVPEHSGGGITYDQKFGKRFYSWRFTGIVKTLAASKLLDKFFMSVRHTEGTGFARYYMIVKTNTNEYYEFTDHTDTRREYCKCNTTVCRQQQNDAENLIWTYEITGFSVWR